MYLFENDELTVWELEKSDISFMAKWLSDSRVLAFYEGRDQPFDEKKVESEFFTKRERGVHPCLVRWRNEPIGYIQFYEIDDDTRALYHLEKDGSIRYGIDQFIGEPEYWNKGIGRLLVSGMTDFLIQKKGADCVVMDPHADNDRALACYTKCGYEKVRFLPEHEWHEGKKRDCWLMKKRK
ncbi:GNAT family N-acetyltransferase [Alteribacter aurantiacus]|uniref:GNAT family N-acetyltransferase n=1 Tax=Alteribacter aurantiacus TaxID=254410 RepID=UPI00040980F0|nr:GNAT family N-acetyltransferase [Alteribacter aurantiacus]